MRFSLVAITVPLIVLSIEGRSRAQGYPVGDGITETATQQTAQATQAIQSSTQTIQTDTSDIRQQTDNHLPNIDKDTAVLNQAQGQVSGMFT